MVDFNEYRKGSVVIVHATVHTKDRRLPKTGNILKQTVLRKVVLYPAAVQRALHQTGYMRDFVKIACDPWYGIIVGWSTRISGEHIVGYGWDNPGQLRQTQTHKVLMVIPTDSERWEPPFACLPEDLELLND